MEDYIDDLIDSSDIEYEIEEDGQDDQACLV